MFEAKIILDSVCKGQRLTTMQLTHPRIVHAEFNTHCMFARNASSSRAIPFKKAVQFVMDDPFIPEHWGINQSGMQAFAELEGEDRDKAIALWLEARDHSVRIAREMAMNGKCETCKGTGMVSEDLCSFTCDDCEGAGVGLNIHKQIVNRLIEPWSWITVCVTGDAGAWSNYFALRCHPDAQPDIQKQAFMAQKAYYESVPNALEPGQWHTPYVRPEEPSQIAEWCLEQNPSMCVNFKDLTKTPFIANRIVEIATGRCARTSYLTQEGTRDFGEDVKLHDRLRFHTPLHASPFEHVCQAMGDGEKYAKYIGWKSYRHFLPKEYVTDFQPNHPDFTVEV
jgi:hypothetical protein